MVKESVTHMKPDKRDLSGGFTSEYLLHAPDKLFDLLATVFRCWMVHGEVTSSVLVCSFLPLLKNQKDETLHDSYRVIAGSSLILQNFERWGDTLRSDSLQFGFKRKCGTSSATWLVQEVLPHYFWEGSRPVAVVLDCTKAFNLAKFNRKFSAVRKSPSSCSETHMLLL